VKDILDVMNISEEQFNLFEHYKIDQCLYGFGLAVDPTYRGRGIATELLKARFPLLKTLGIKITTTAFTGPASQAAARKAGYHEDLVLQ
jgi:RimJ/RimL family protein N-acetyltransferase